MVTIPELETDCLSYTLTDVGEMIFVWSFKTGDPNHIFNIASAEKNAFYITNFGNISYWSFGELLTLLFFKFKH